MEFHLRNNNNKSSDNKPKKKVNFPFKDNIIYVINYRPPFAYIRPADRLLLSVFDNFIDEWNIEYNGVEGKVKAILMYYGLPLMREKTPNSIIPNIEDLEKASDIKAYYYVAIQWILKDLENTQPNQLMKLVDIMKDPRGMPIKVKDLENKKIKNFTGNPKGILYDLIDIIQLSKEINLEEAIPGSDKPAFLRALGFLMPKSIEQVRSVLYLILIGAVFVIAFMFIKTFAATLSNVEYLQIFHEYNLTNITLLLNKTNLTNLTGTTFHVTNPLG
jgi:hypothetical protein